MAKPTDEELEATAERLGLPTDASVLADLEILTRSNRGALVAGSQKAEEPHFFARGAYTFGYVTAMICPVVGFWVGLALIARGDDDEGRDGAWIVGISVLSALVGAALIVLAVRS